MTARKSARSARAATVAVITFSPQGLAVAQFARCAEQGVRFTGTVGILKACCLDGTLSLVDADAILQTMVAAGYHAPVRRISDLV